MTQHNYARLSYAHELFHIVASGKRLKPRATAACGVKRIAQIPGDKPMWEDCRVRVPQNVCGMCLRAVSQS